MINDLAVFDKTIMPALVVPLDITVPESKKYLGGRYIKDNISIKFSYIAKTREQAAAMYSFWKNECEFGTKPFIVSINILGINEENGHLIACKWKKGINASNESVIHKGTIELEMIYAVNQLNELVEL